MTLRDLNDFRKEDILDALGLEAKRTTADWLLPSVAVFGAGVMVGVGVGLLMAPKSGTELRSELETGVRRAVGQAADQAKDQFSQAKDQLSQVASNFNERQGSTESTGKAPGSYGSGYSEG